MAFECGLRAPMFERGVHLLQTQDRIGVEHQAESTDHGVEALFKIESMAIRHHEAGIGEAGLAQGRAGEIDAARSEIGCEHMAARPDAPRDVQRLVAGACCHIKDMLPLINPGRIEHDGCGVAQP